MYIRWRVGREFRARSPESENHRFQFVGKIVSFWKSSGNVGSNYARSILHKESISGRIIATRVHFNGKLRFESLKFKGNHNLNLRIDSFLRRKCIFPKNTKFPLLSESLRAPAFVFFMLTSTFRSISSLRKIYSLSSEFVNIWKVHYRIRMRGSEFFDDAENGWNVLVRDMKKTQVVSNSPTTVWWEFVFVEIWFARNLWEMHFRRRKESIFNLDWSSPNMLFVCLQY